MWANILVYCTTGDFGGIRAGALVLPFLNELGIIPLPSRVALPTVHKKFDAETSEPTDERFKAAVQRMAHELAWYTEALSNQKVASGPPKSA